MRLRRTRAGLVAYAPAKLNLFLEVRDKRPDGFHELETLMVSVGVYDSLCFREEHLGTIGLRCFDGRSGAARPEQGLGCLPDGRKNLVVRAAELLREFAGIRKGVQIDLLKRIPVAAGLAGGSSDAAATLVALNEVWRLNLSASELGHLASQLGSDVNFFLAQAPFALCEGRGELVQPLDLPAHLHFVIVRPAAGLSTADVFRRCRPSPSPRDSGQLRHALTRGRLSEVRAHLFNALQPPAIGLRPELKELDTTFRGLFRLGHLMSGSGTAFFGICGSRSEALRLAARLRSQRMGYVFVTSSRP